MRILKTVFAIAALAIPMAAEQVQIRVPFDFEVQGQKLAAGRYTVSAETGRAIIAFRPMDPAASQVHVIPTTSDVGKYSEVSKLVFRKVGQRYFLAKVVASNQTSEFGKTKAEREAATSTISRNAELPSEVTVLAGGQ